MKIGLIVDRLTIARWQADALATIDGEHEFMLYNCTNTVPGRRSLAHALYYLLNLLTLRTKLTASTAVTSSILRQTDFQSQHEGIWQRLPPSLLNIIRQDSPDLILKLGMGLLRVPSRAELKVPILSYHHGDPRHFRGRPAGFYELTQGRPTVGQVIQILSNKLDAGEIVAFGETKAHKHSYRATMFEAYRISPFLLRAAIFNLQEGHRHPFCAQGTIYKLPDNGMVIRFAAQRFVHLGRRMFYGAFIEKAWQVAEAPIGSIEPIVKLSGFPAPDRWRILQGPNKYRFLADPFHHPIGDGVLVEALRRSTGLGEILHLAGTRAECISDGRGHYSYPGTFSHADEHYVVPEMSEWSCPKVFRLANSKLEEVGYLDVPTSPRLLDPTLYAHAGKLFLFANCAAEGSSVLRLWVSGGITESFREHPRSPVCLSPTGARMGGAILSLHDAQYRVGQDLRREYGDGIVLFRIDQLSADHYKETKICELKFSHVRGPHTFNVRNGSVLFDWYSNRFSILAGLRRARSILMRLPQSNG